MKTQKDDRRVKYTKMVLKESFIQLLEKKEISKITIKEICENADINRATFYTHYRDQYDLLKKIEWELIDNIKTHLAQIDKNDTNNNVVLLTEKIFVYIKDNAKICKLLLSDRGDFEFQKSVIILVYDKIFTELVNSNRLTKEEAEYVYSFTITGYIGIVQKWLNEDLEKSPRFMAEMVINLTMSLMSYVKR